MDGSEAPEQASQRELDRLAREVRWLTEHARETARTPSLDLLARCTVFTATLGVLLAYCLPWGRGSDDDTNYVLDDAPRLTGWQLIGYWQDVQSGTGGFLAWLMLIVVVPAAIAGLCVLVPMPRTVGLALAVLLWLLTFGLGLGAWLEPDRLEFDFELTAWIAVIITGALASSWSWWTSCSDAGWWRTNTRTD